MSQTLPPTGWIPARQSGQTGKRERLSWGLPQMRQSDGNKTEKRLSVKRLTQGRSIDVALADTALAQGRSGADEVSRETIECPATAALAWLARIRSSLLLKTASFVTPRTPTRRGQSFSNACSIAAMTVARQRCGRRPATVSPASSVCWASSSARSTSARSTAGRLRAQKPAGSLAGNIPRSALAAGKATGG